MPRVEVTRNRLLLNDREIGPLTRYLCGTVAECLSCEGGELATDEIEVRVREPGPFDRNYSNLQIEIFADACPEREANRQERSDQIESDLRKFCLEGGMSPMLFDDSSFVWLCLFPAGFTKLKSHA